ncbi:winged helix-turn-helix domain-containing protein [Shinella sp. CPCC 101442]|uniref:winged helix-turn-helix domain-containing protein n=1 Tax=Shinella sp. CPCC 101442 TaxID=2932265 RepID=UPI0021524B75|nr:winged helix-turn-helix domain-containing protein [Shinella sp. CPCC 101442]MCR6500154.1 winged helix-turn-helix domain-containing protein [Shinella sp. CPCC 101442]
MDPDRVELRGPDGVAIHLRPKTFELLRLLVANSHRLLTKQELLDAIWPGVHVGEDSLFQCIREIRSALGDDQRQTVKLVSGRGYHFAADVSTREDTPAIAAVNQPGAVSRFRLAGRRGGLLSAGLAILAAGVAFTAFLALSGSFSGRPEPVIAVVPFTVKKDDPESVALAHGVAGELIGGLSRIDGIRLVTPPEEGSRSTAQDTDAATLLVEGVLQKDPRSWTLQVRLIDAVTREIQSVADIAIDARAEDARYLQSRLAAGAGYALALRLNTLENGESISQSDPANIAIQQATASINQTTRERFATARAILEKNRTAEPDNVDVQVALAALHLRAIQMNWYPPGEESKAENDARALLEAAVKAMPNSASVLGTYCRFLTATNQFPDSLVTCARTLAINPWDGAALFQLGLTQLQLGRFEDALASFVKADSFGTPEVSRWTWLLGAGLASLILERDEEAAQWLTRSLAVTPASGRTYMLLAVAYQRLGRQEEAEEALRKGMALRPGSTTLNIALPTRNASETYLQAGRKISDTLAGMGLPRDGKP